MENEPDKNESAEAAPKGRTAKIRLDVAPLKGDDPDDWLFIYAYCFSDLHFMFEQYANEGKLPALRGTEAGTGKGVVNGAGEEAAGQGAADDDEEHGAAEERKQGLSDTTWISFLKDGEDIEDCVSDAFARLAIKGREFKSLDHAKAWLFREALGLAYNLRWVAMSRQESVAKMGARKRIDADEYGSSVENAVLNKRSQFPSY